MILRLLPLPALFLLLPVLSLDILRGEEVPTPRGLIDGVADALRRGRHDSGLLLREYLLEYRRVLFNASAKERYSVEHRVMKRGDELVHEIRVKDFPDEERGARGGGGETPPSVTLSLVNSRGAWIFLKGKREAGQREEVMRKNAYFTLEGLLPFILNFEDEMEDLAGRLDSCTVEGVEGDGKGFLVMRCKRSPEVEVEFFADKKTILPSALRISGARGEVKRVFKEYRKVRRDLSLPMRIEHWRGGHLTVLVEIERLDTSPSFDEEEFDEDRIEIE